MTVTITGASGFIGQNLKPFLQEAGHKVHALSLREKGWALPPCDAVIHLAGKAHDTAGSSGEAAYFEINTGLTKEVFTQFLNSDARDFFYFSSVKAAADSLDGILDENHVPAPRTPYGRSKLAAENHLLAQKLPDGKRLFIIRPAMVHGPGNKGNLNLLYKIVQKGLPWPLAAFENKRSFLSIANLNALVRLMIENRSLGSGIYNFADDETVSTNRLIALIAASAGKAPRLWHLPQVLISLVATLGDGLPLPLNSARLRKLTESYVVSNAKIKAALGISRLPLSAEEGLIVTLKSFAEDNSKGKSKESQRKVKG